MNGRDSPSWGAEGVDKREGLCAGGALFLGALFFTGEREDDTALSMFQNYGLRVRGLVLGA